MPAGTAFLHRPGPRSRRWICHQPFQSVMTEASAHPKPKIVPKPWGREVWWAQSTKYTGKLLIIEKGHRLSLSYHRVKHETVYTLRGRCRLVLGRKRST